MGVMVLQGACKHSRTYSGSTQIRVLWVTVGYRGSQRTFQVSMMVYADLCVKQTVCWLIQLLSGSMFKRKK